MEGDRFMSIYDMLLANAMGESGGGGGGGSSDFSTATLTVVNNGLTAAGLNVFRVFDQSGLWGLDPNTLPLAVGNDNPTVESNETATIENIVIYKGHALVSCDGSPAVSGNITLLDSDRGLYDMSGDGTLTISE